MLSPNQMPGHRIRVKLPNISKALYFLYLRHPEGLRFKDISGHKDELLHLYGGITGRDGPAEIEKEHRPFLPPRRSCRGAPGKGPPRARLLPVILLFVHMTCFLVSGTKVRELAQRR